MFPNDSLYLSLFSTNAGAYNLNFPTSSPFTILSLTFYTNSGSLHRFDCKSPSSATTTLFYNAGNTGITLPVYRRFSVNTMCELVAANGDDIVVSATYVPYLLSPTSTPLLVIPNATTAQPVYLSSTSSDSGVSGAINSLASTFELNTQILVSVLLVVCSVLVVDFLRRFFVKPR